MVDLPLQLLHFGGHAITAVATAAVAYWMVVSTDLSSKRWLAVWMANFSLWSLVSMASVAVSHQPTGFVLFWLWSLVGIAAVALTILFATAYSGRNPMTNRLCQLSTGLLAVLALLSASGPFHSYYWRSVSFRETPFPHFVVEYGPGWITTVVISLGAVGLLVYYFAELYFRSRRHQRRAVVALALGGVLGVGPVLLSHADILVPTYEYYAFTGSTQALAVGYAAVRFGPGNLSTVARDETLDYLVDPYLALDTEYRIVDFNAASSRLIDGLDADRIGEPLAAVFPELADRLTTDGGIDEPDEPLTFDGGGTQQHYSIAVSQISDWNSTKCYAVVLNNVTELEASRQQIEAQNEQLDAFVGTVSHDLRAPLSVIGGRLELATTDCDSEHLDHIADAHGRMDELIEDLLTLAREGQAVGQPRPVELAVVADQAWRSVDASRGSLAVETDRTVLADRSRLQQLLENLLGNCIEHGSTVRQSADAAEGHAAETTAGVRITLGELDDGFYIEDNGPGIPAADRDSVFETGYTTNDDGTGFGLAIVNQIVEAHGWEVRATDGKTGGARFEITGVELAS